CASVSAGEPLDQMVTPMVVACLSVSDMRGKEAPDVAFNSRTRCAQCRPRPCQFLSFVRISTPSVAVGAESTTPSCGAAMTIRLHRCDLPDLSRYQVGAVAIDTETMGLDPNRDRLCVVQISPGDGSADVVQIPAGTHSAPNL